MSSQGGSSTVGSVVQIIPLVPVDDAAPKTKRMMQILQQFRADFENAINESASGSAGSETSVNLKSIFHEIFPSKLARQISDDNDMRKEISYAIRGIYPVHAGYLFTDGVISGFECIVRRNINRVYEPSMRCVDMVVAEVLKISKRCAEKMASYPLLREECQRVATEQTRACEQTCKKQLQLLTQIQLAYINTNHEDFIGFDEASLRSNSGSGNQPGDRPFKSNDPQFDRHVETIRILVESYMRIVHKTTLDIVPKIVMHMIVENLKNRLCSADLLAHACLLG